ncbi:MAG: two-component sensor histidine kinase, partial [Firmicutes bacterium]|nr:two-component sensor histidine kinase [Bacillota bacterium]
ELRNPVGIIRATVQVLEQELPDAEGARTALKIIREQADRQNQLLHELLEFGRARPALVQPLNVGTLLGRVLEFTAPLLRRHGVELDCRLAQDLPPVEGDAERLKQVFVNLILNAVEAMPGGGRLTVSARVLPDEGAGGRVAVSFEDTGPGIPEEDLSRIFEPFYTTKDRGVGLGLAITHRFVELHGGRIDVESRPGEGATFTVVLPAVAREEAKGNGR